MVIRFSESSKCLNAKPDRETVVYINIFMSQVSLSVARFSLVSIIKNDVLRRKVSPGINSTIFGSIAMRELSE